VNLNSTYNYNSLYNGSQSSLQNPNIDKNRVDNFYSDTMQKKIDTILPRLRASSTIKRHHKMSEIAKYVDPVGFRRLGYKRKHYDSQETLSTKVGL
jgi:hypothetical protein